MLAGVKHSSSLSIRMAGLGSKNTTFTSICMRLTHIPVTTGREEEATVLQPPSVSRISSFVMDDTKALNAIIMTRSLLNPTCLTYDVYCLTGSAYYYNISTDSANKGAWTRQHLL